MSRRQLDVETSLRSPRLVRTLARDPFVLTGVLVFVLIAVVYRVPFLDDVALEFVTSYVITITWLLLVTAATFWGLRDVQHLAERHFWARVGTAFLCWSLADVLYAIGVLDQHELIRSMTQDGLYLLSYLAWIFALEARPHVKTGRDLRVDARDFARAGRFLFATGLFAYAVLLPRAVLPGGHIGWVPSFVFYVALDLYIAARLAARWHRSDAPRWRFHYGLLSLGMFVVAITDTFQVMTAGGYAQPLSEVMNDVRWSVSMAIIVVAVRARSHRFPGPGARAGKHEERDPTGVRLLAYSLVLPILHLTLHEFVAVPAELDRARGLFALVWIFVLGGPSLAHHLRLEARRREAEEQLRLSEQKHRKTLEAAPNSITIARHSDGLILQVNHYFTKMLGYSREEAIGRTSLDLNLFVRTEDWDGLISILEDEGEVDDLEVKYRRKDGAIIDTLLSARPLRYESEDCLVAVVTDISARVRSEEERLALERQLLHAQKLESLGVLAGGIAHDFNNLLTGIMGNAELARLRLSPDSPIRKRIAGISEASTRAAELCRQMLAYSGKGRFVVEGVDLSTLSEEMVHLLEVAISKKVRLELDLARDLPLVEADATQLRQVVMNLVTNASEAIGSASGQIRVITGVMHCDESYLAETSPGGDLLAGRYVFLEVADTGCGMDPETAARMFDPFFSTKFSGRGLGLAAVLGIAGAHRGAIRVDSRRDRGTAVRMLLPPSNRGVAELDKTGLERAGWRGSGTVLFADDDEAARSATQPMLEALGFDVLTACDGREALDAFDRHRDEIVLVLLDMTMPEMDGQEAHMAMRCRGLAVPVVIATGYHERDASSRFVGDSPAGFLQKPFRLSTLSESVRLALESVPKSETSSSGTVPKGTGGGARNETGE